MHRYISSFFIAFIFHASIASGFIFYKIDDKTITPDTKNDKTVKIQLSSFIEKPKVIHHQVKKAQVDQKKLQTKQVRKKVQPIIAVEKELIPFKAKKKIEKKKIHQELAEVLAPKEEEVIQKAVQELPLQTALPQITDIQKTVDQELVKSKQKNFLKQLVEKINANKFYPYVARRRAIQGNVEVMFEVLSDGSVQNIKLLSGKKIFQKSTLEAISKSFPLEVEKSLFNYPKEFKITIAYVLK